MFAFPRCMPQNRGGTRDCIGAPEEEHPSGTLCCGFGRCLSPTARCQEITPCVAGLQTDPELAFTTCPSASLRPSQPLQVHFCNSSQSEGPAEHPQVPQESNTSLPSRKGDTPQSPKAQPPSSQVQPPTPFTGGTGAIGGEVCHRNG